MRAEEEISAAGDGHEAQKHGIDHLKSIYKYLSTNKDSVKVVARQRQFFVSLALRSRATVHGLLAIGLDNVGEIVPVHLLTVLTDLLKANSDAAAEEDLLQHKKSPETYFGHSKSGGNAPISSPCMTDLVEGPPGTGESERGWDGTGEPTLQTKRIPFDALQLSTEEHSLSRWSNAAGRRRQQVRSTGHPFLIFLFVISHFIVVVR